jgi:hypothetical protein
MRFVTTPAAAQLTGISTVTLREWTNSRALIQADVPPKGMGAPARFTWHTILLLRVAVVLRDRFHFELHPHQNLFASLKAGFQRSSFIALWGKSLILRGDNGWSFVEDVDGLPFAEDAVVIRLQPHLEALSADFSLPHPTKSSGQVELFPAWSIDAPTNAITATASAKFRDATVPARWRSA